MAGFEILEVRNSISAFMEVSHHFEYGEPVVVSALERQADIAHILIPELGMNAFEALPQEFLISFLHERISLI